MLENTMRAIKGKGLGGGRREAKKATEEKSCSEIDVDSEQDADMLFTDSLYVMRSMPWSSLWDGGRVA